MRITTLWIVGTLLVLSSMMITGCTVTAGSSYRYPYDTYWGPYRYHPYPSYPYRYAPQVRHRPPHTIGRPSHLPAGGHYRPRPRSRPRTR